MADPATYDPIGGAFGILVAGFCVPYGLIAGIVEIIIEVQGSCWQSYATSPANVGWLGGVTLPPIYCTTTCSANSPWS